MTFGESIKTCFRKYAEFNGRATRSEFWYFVLFLVLVDLGVGFLSGLFMIPLILKGEFNADSILSTSLPFKIISLVVGLAFLLPNLSVWTRRLHDRNKSGWWIVTYFVLCLVPAFLLNSMVDHVDQLNENTGGGVILGLAVLVILVTVLAIVLLVWCCKRGTIGPNQYGPDPLEDTYVDVTPQTEA